MNLTRDQIDGMDDMANARLTFDTACPEDACGIVHLPHSANLQRGVSLSRSERLVSRISHRQYLLARLAMTDKMRRALEDANDMDEQELCLIGSKHTAGILAQWAWGLAVLILSVAGLVHFLAANWG